MIDFFLHEAKASLLRARETDDIASKVADELDTALTATARALAALKPQICESCHGEGEIMVNPSRRYPQDPQMAEPARCPVCHGEGLVVA